MIVYIQRNKKNLHIDCVSMIVDESEIFD
jgi:hypothetical protein